MKLIDIDFETRSEADLLAVGSCVYSEHPSTEVMIVTYSFENSPKVYEWNPFNSRREKPWALLWAVENGYTIKAWHSEFEYWIWNNVCTRQFGWPKLPIDRFLCAMGIGCATTFPAKLEDAAKASRAEYKKNESGKALINFFSKPSRKKGAPFNNPLEHPEKFDSFREYGKDDVYAQKAIWSKCEPLSESEIRCLQLTEKMNIRGIPVDMELVHGALELVARFRREADAEAQEIIRSLGQEPPFATLNQRDAVRDWLRANGCPIPDMQKATIERILNEPDGVPEYALRVLELRSQYAKSSVAKYEAFAAMADSQGRVHGFIKYHIARTGRWGGRGIQIQNFPKPPKNLPKNIDWDVVADLIRRRKYSKIKRKYGNVMDVLSGALRAAIKAPDGYKFIAADYSQIEARGVFWFAEDPVGLAEFSGEGKIYEGMAATIFGVKKEDIQKGSFERDIGKATILGAGFGMGPDTFVTNVEDTAGITIDGKLAQRAISGYRNRYEMVPKLWKGVEKAAIAATKNPGSVHTYKKVSYYCKGDRLYCILPSGRKLVYLEPQVKVKPTQFGEKETLTYMGQDTYTRKWVRLQTWGGKLTENFVQAAARDIMVYGMENAERDHYYLVFSVHDEGVTLVPEEFGSYQELERLLCELPVWAKGYPIAAEGWEGTRYRK